MLQIICAKLWAVDYFCPRASAPLDQQGVPRDAASGGLCRRNYVEETSAHLLPSDYRHAMFSAKMRCLWRCACELGLRKRRKSTGE